jgi:hypothetical protein
MFFFLFLHQGAEQPFRDQLVGCVLNMCQADRYARLSDFSWYVTVLADLARVPESNHGKQVKPNSQCSLCVP